MKKLFALMMMASCTTAIAVLKVEELQQGDAQNISLEDLLKTRASENPEETKTTLTTLSRCTKIAKGLGVGSFSLFCGLLCIGGVYKFDDTHVGYLRSAFKEDSDMIRKVGAVGVSLFSLIFAAELGGHSLRNFQEAWQG